MIAAMSRRRSSRASEAGLFRGCCFGLVVLVILLALTLFVGVRALAAPDLGSAPGGTSHGSSEVLIAAELAGTAGTQLLAGEHAVLVLSERDLTVLAQANNPSPLRFRNPQARIRNGQVVISATTSVGPFGTTAVVNMQLVFSNSNGQVQVTAQPVSYGVGTLPVPDWIATQLAPSGGKTLNLTHLFTGNPPLEALAQTMECVAVLPDGVHVGFHRPLAAADPSRCTSAAAASGV
jgi:hypothetical protein